MSKDLRNALIAAAFFLLATGLVGYQVYDMQQVLDGVLAENNGLTGQIESLKAEASDQNIAAATKQRDDLEQNFKEYVKILPSEEVATEEMLLRTVQKYVTDAGVVLENYTRAAGRGTGDFQEIGVTLRCSCVFDQLVNFLNLLERHESFLRVNTFTLSPGGGASKLERPVGTADPNKDWIPLGINLEISTFRYIPKK